MWALLLDRDNLWERSHYFKCVTIPFKLRCLFCCCYCCFNFLLLLPSALFFFSQYFIKWGFRTFMVFVFSFLILTAKSFPKALLKLVGASRVPFCKSLTACPETTNQAGVSLLPCYNEVSKDEYFFIVLSHFSCCSFSILRLTCWVI